MGKRGPSAPLETRLSAWAGVGKPGHAWASVGKRVLRELKVGQLEICVLWSYRHEESNKQVCVVAEKPERKLQKALCGRVLQAAQLSAQ